MSKHEHQSCPHDLHHCERCDTVYCTLCVLEWTRIILSENIPGPNSYLDMLGDPGMVRAMHGTVRPAPTTDGGH